MSVATVDIAASNKLFLNRLQRANNILIFVVLLIVSTLLFTVHATTFHWFPTIAIVSILITSDLIFFSYLKTGRFLSFRVIFIALTCLFHLGYSWIYLFNPTFSFEGMDFELMFDSSLVLRSYLLSLSLILAVYLGMQLSDHRVNARDNLSTRAHRGVLRRFHISKKFSDVSYRNLAIALLLITVPARLYIDLSRIALSEAGDYLSIFSLEANGYLFVLADMTLIGIILLLVYLRRKPIAASVVVWLSSAYYLYSMSSGSRGGAVISIIVLLFAYTLCARKLKKTTVAILGISALFMGSYLVSTSATRLEREVDATEKSGVVSKFLQEFGGTQLTTILTVRAIEQDESLELARGSTYIASMVAILPNLNPAFEEYIESNNFQKRLNYPAIGGSYLAELYYNFGYISLIIAIFAGYLLGRFEQLILAARRYERFIVLAYLLFVMKQSLWWIRDSAFVFPRHMVIGGLLLLLLCLLMRKFGLIEALNDKRGKRYA